MREWILIAHIPVKSGNIFQIFGRRTILIGPEDASLRKILLCCFLAAQEKIGEKRVKPLFLSAQQSDCWLPQTVLYFP